MSGELGPEIIEQLMQVADKSVGEVLTELGCELTNWGRWAQVNYYPEEHPDCPLWCDLLIHKPADVPPYEAKEAVHIKVSPTRYENYTYVYGYENVQKLIARLEEQVSCGFR